METEADIEAETRDIEGTHSQVDWRGGDLVSCDQPHRPRPRRQTVIQTLDRGTPRVTQRPRAPSPELLKQSRDQGCGSPASLPSSLPPTLEFPAPAVPPPHSQGSISSPGPRLELSFFLAAVCVYVLHLCGVSRCLLCKHIPLPYHHCPHNHRPGSCTPLHIYHTVSHTHSNPETCPGPPSQSYLDTGPEDPTGTQPCGQVSSGLRSVS